VSPGILGLGLAPTAPLSRPDPSYFHRRRSQMARMKFRSASLVTALTLALVALPAALSAQEGGNGESDDDNPVRWRNSAELSYLVSGGNSLASTLGLRVALRRDAPRGDLRVDGSLLRTQSTRLNRFAVGTTEDFQVHTDRQTERTAERYSAEVRYDLNLGDRTFASGSTGWQRNTFAGFRGRTVVALGGGTRWSSDDAWELKLGAGLTYTFQQDVDPDPDRETRFGGVRLTLDHERAVTSGTDLELKWVADANAEDRRDVRADLSQAVSASLTTRLSLKTTLQLLVDNDPPLIRISLQDEAGEDTGETVRVPLRKVDRVLSVALVITL
jgi:putative salt-induced outer membrane protein YdiY